MQLQRHQTITELVREHGFMGVDALAEALGVTPQTVRRDINRLCADGVLRRYHGGAALNDGSMRESNAARRCREGEKKRIAELLAAHIPDNASLFIGIGTTMETVAAALAQQRKNLNVITNNIHVAAMLSARNDYTVIITSGVVRPVDGGVTGVATVDFINQFKADYAVLSTSGIEADGSLLDYDYKEVSVMQAMMANARCRYLAADHSKFTCRALVKVGHITDFHKVFTDQPPEESLRTILEEAEIPLLLAQKQSK
ncbi:DeoR/GlpR family DNA-binding transcription regulator [Neisseria sp.]|uniref:DeoR/GlpR family DNA-binding transcription regulator n=1 Tax=Neisseria sp. TaxID=192066 RepID=UPI0035A0E3D4